MSWPAIHKEKRTQTGSCNKGSLFSYMADSLKVCVTMIVVIKIIAIRYYFVVVVVIIIFIICVIVMAACCLLVLSL